MIKFVSGAAVMMLATLPVTSFAEPTCSLGAATYSSGDATLKFDSDAGNKIVLTVGTLRLEGVIIAMNGGDTVFELSETGLSEDDGPSVLTDTFYTLQFSKKAKAILSGGWVANVAPQAVLLSNVNRHLLRLLQEKGRGSEFVGFDDIFNFYKCNS
jgi:hypothetical protein